MKFEGSCHCGKVRFAFNGVIEGAITCNCSICSRKGAMLVAVSEAEFEPLTPDDEMSAYTFNSHAIVHHFCRTCGIQPYARHAEQRSVYVNLRCVEDINLGAISTTTFDGRSV